MSEPSILYLGDTSLNGAAGYLAGLMTAFRLTFDYLPSDLALSADAVGSERKLFILSDYPSAMMPASVQDAILAQVQRGAGLLMIGGWESFHGHGGNWDGTPIGDALPVVIGAEDDRQNCDQTAIVISKTQHEISAGLPWNDRPPTVGGYNLVTAKLGATTVLEVLPFKVHHAVHGYSFGALQSHPLLVTGAHGPGRTAALMTDLAPHWVGGLVDWGEDERVTAQAPGSWQIEVGNLYAQLVLNLLAWTGRLARTDIA